MRMLLQLWDSKEKPGCTFLLGLFLGLGFMALLIRWLS